MKRILRAFFVMVGIITLSNYSYAQCLTTSTPTNNCSFGDQIDYFSLNGIATTGNSGCSTSGYGFFSTPVRNLTIGSTYSYLAIVGGPFSYYEGFAIWIDLNNNGIYEATEMLVSSSPSTFHSGTITIPGTATAGTNIRMRTRASYLVTHTGSQACTNSLGSFGETEDYYVNLIGGSGCSGTPAPGNTLSTVNPVCSGQSFTLSMQNAITGSGVTYQWQSSPNNSTWTNITGATSTSLATTQTVATYYRCGATCGSNTGFSNSLLVNMNSPLNCYCAASNSSGCGFSDVINNVTFGTLNNSSGCTATPAYTNYGGSVAAPNISIGVTTPISVTVGPGGTENVAAWIDYNQNGTFETTEYTSIGSGNGVTINNNITVPVTALGGLTRMRVRVRYFSSILNTDPCTTFSYGETEDYNVNLVCTAPTFTSQPAPSPTLCAGSNLTLTATATGSGIGYQWQVNTGTGFTNITNGGVYSGATTSSLLLTLPPATFNGFQYRCIATVACSTATATSNTSTLSVGAPTGVVSMTPNTTACNGSAVNFVVNASGTNLTYQWQVHDGTGYYNIANAGIYSGATTSTLSISAVNPAMNNYAYRVVLTGSCPPNLLISQASILTIGSGIPVITQPANFTVCAGSTGTFSVATGGANVVYQWQVNTGSGFTNVTNGTNYSGATTATLSTLTTPITFNGYQYRCVLSNTCTGALFTAAATLSVQPAPVVTSQPATVTTCDFQNVSFAVGATGAGLSYQWQINTGLGFVNLNNTAPYGGAFTPTLTVANVNGGMNGYQYQCVITGNCTPAVVTNIATLNVNTQPVITTFPVSTTVCENGTTAFTIAATGTNVTYQWQVDVGGTFSNVTNTGVYSGATTSVLTLSGVPNSLHGRGYRCIVGGTCPPAVTSNTAVLYVNAVPTVFSQPVDKQVCVGSAVTFTTIGTAATMTGALSYQWQLDNGTGYVNLANGAPYSNVTTNNLTITGATTALNTFKFRCVISNQSCTPPVITSGALLTVYTLPAVTTQPTNKTVCPGAPVTFSLTATGTGTTYQWQQNNGSGFQDLPGGAPYTGTNTPSMTIANVSLTMQGYQYRCIVRGTCSPAAVSGVATLNVLNPVTINSSSVTDTVCEGGTTRLGVRATGAGVLYQWQRMQTNGTFANLTNNPPYSGVNTDSLRIQGAPSTINGAIYRCAITENQLCGLWYYTPNIPIGIRLAPVANPAVLTVNPYQIATFAVPPTGTSYQWQENDNSGNGFRNLTEGGSYTGVFTNTLRIYPIQLTMAGNMYRCLVDGVCAATVPSSSSLLQVDPLLSVTGVQKNIDIDVYPNPMTGSELNVSFKQMLKGNTEVKVLDKLGKVVYSEKMELNSVKVAKLNLTSLAAGVYMLQIINADENVSETIQFVKK